tara:strand:+ start:1666 stop:3534 length:1869 start_codon:yes stop_codon:yes gene_type:complete
MSDAAAKLQISELDFDTIKTNLKNFLGDQNEFSDYNFDGSAMSVLLDVLAYNTHYNAFYMNMIANEMFLDTASIRNSVVSRAKHLGYTPKSSLGAKAYVDIKIVPPDTPSTIIIEKDTQFASSVNGISYVFCTSKSTTVNVNSNGSYQTANVELSQGIPLTHRYTANTNDPDQRFILPNSNTDTSTLTVKIQSSATVTNLFSYTLANDTTTVNSTANVYWVEEAEDGKYQVLFGDGIVGRKPSTGNIVILSSLISDSTAPNGAKVFTPVGDVGGYSNVTVTTLTNAFGGADKDTIQDIKFNAPRSFQAQNRAVTVNDYIRILQRDYSAAESVVAWGGEENDPPVYGKIYLAIKPKAGESLSVATKEYIKDTVLGSRNVVSVTPEIVDPDYMYISVDTTVKYNSSKTELTSDTIRNKISNTIYQYGQKNLGLFADEFRYSPMIQQIDQTESSIESSLTTVKLKRTFIPTLNVASSYTLNYSNKISTTSNTSQIESNLFSHYDDTGSLKTNCGLQDSNGVLQVYRTSGVDRVIVANNVGSISYATGNVAISSFRPISIDDGGANIHITTTIESNDIKPLREQILLISNNDVTVSMIDTLGTGKDTKVSTTDTTTSTSTSSSGSY